MWSLQLLSLLFSLQAAWRNLWSCAHTSPAEANMRTGVRTVERACSPKIVTNLLACKKHYFSVTHTHTHILASRLTVPASCLHAHVGSCSPLECTHIFPSLPSQLHVLVHRTPLHVRQRSHSHSAWVGAADCHQLWGGHAHLCPGRHHLLLRLQEVSICGLSPHNGVLVWRNGSMSCKYGRVKAL